MAITQDQLIRDTEVAIANLDDEITIDERNLAHKRGRRAALAETLIKIRQMKPNAS